MPATTVPAPTLPQCIQGLREMAFALPRGHADARLLLEAAAYLVPLERLARLRAEQAAELQAAYGSRG